MKRILTSSLFLFALIAYAFAQVPQGFSYQAVARDSAGECLANTLISIQISILEGSASGTELYKEEFNNIQTNEAGLFHLQIGTGSLQGASPSFDNLHWFPSDPPRYLKIDLAPDNTNNFVHVGSTQLLTVPYAMASDETNHAAESDHALTSDHSDHALTSDAANTSAHSDTAMFAHMSGNGIQTNSGGFENLNWHGSNGSLNGILGATGPTQDNGIIRLYDDQANQQVILTANELAGGEDVGALSLYGDNSTLNVSLGINGTHGPNRGALSLRDDSGIAKIWALANSNNEGLIQIFGPNGEQNITLKSVGGGAYDHGMIQVKDDTGAVSIDLRSHAASNGAGLLALYGANNNKNIEFGPLNSTTAPNKGIIRVKGDDGSNLLNTGANTNGVGFAHYFGTNGNLNVAIGNNGSSSNDPNNYGTVNVFDPLGNIQARMYAYYNPGLPTSQFQGRIEADVKNFVMDHPLRPGKEIVYTCIEGPEVAAYERGTAQLVNGEAEIFFSETFEIVANPNTMTVMTSPWSADAKGLAIVERTATGFKVKELGGGTGNYQFDWEAKAVRKGFESFPVIRDKYEPGPITQESEGR